MTGPWWVMVVRPSIPFDSGMQLYLTILTFKNLAAGNFVGALAETPGRNADPRALSRRPHGQGQALRFVQEYFLVACSFADLVRRFRFTNPDWQTLPDKIAIQINDTHPSMAVPELMRILLDDVQLGWDEAWNLTQGSLAYTNHTLSPEALEKWPVIWFERMLPRHLEIIYEINRRLIAHFRTRYPEDEGLVQRVSLVDEGGERKIRMANLAIVGSHSTNGVATIHSELLRTKTVTDLAEVSRTFQQQNQRCHAPPLVAVGKSCSPLSITDAIGDGWITDLSQLNKLKPLAKDLVFRSSFLKAKRQAKLEFVDWLKQASGQVVDADTIFDCQIKRIHEYKRQLLNALRIVVLYNRLRENPNQEVVPRTFFFAGKAAPAYHLAKVIIKFINNLADTIDNDPMIRGRIKVLFLPDYCVSMAEQRRFLRLMSPIRFPPPAMKQVARVT